MPVLILAVLLTAAVMLSACGTDSDKTNGSEEATVTLSDSGTESDKTEEPDEEPRVEDWVFTANTIEEAQSIYNDFLYLTIYDDNLSVTVSNGDEMIMTETIDGDSDHIFYSSDYEEFCYKDGSDYYYAVADGINKYYFIDKDKYEENILAFFFYVDVFEDLPSEDVTVNLTSRGTSTFTEYDIIIDATLDLEINFDNVSMTISAVKEKDFVNSYTCAVTDEDGSYTITITFETGNASVTLPDISDWFNASAPRVESEWYVTGKVGGENYDGIPMYFDYVTGCYKTDCYDIVVGDNFTVKNKNDASIAYSWEIDVDLIEGLEAIVYDPAGEALYLESDAEP